VRKGGDEGESLVEIVMSLVLIGLVVSALMAGLATVARASKAQRDLVKVDTVLRAYAESVKYEVRKQCTIAGASYVDPFAAAPPTGFIASQTGPQTCPAATAVGLHTLTVSGNGVLRSMQIEVRLP
jgi:type II secretory pathway pseudopilin PulG